MRHVLAAFFLVCVVATAAAGWCWQHWLNLEITPCQYGALYALRRMDPAMFRTIMLPELEKALADGQLTNGELRAIHAKIDRPGRTFLAAVQAQTWDEQLKEGIQDAGDRAKEKSRNLEESLGKTLDGLMDYLEKKSREFTEDDSPSDPYQTETF